jgi:hypothetical protein
MVAGAKYTLVGVPGLELPIQLAIPLRSALSPRLGQDLGGLAGGDLFRQFVVEIDYAAHTLTLHDKEAFKYAGKGEVIPIEFDAQRHPSIGAEVTPVGGKPIAGRFKIDTGAQHAIALHSPFVKEHGLPGDTPTIEDMKSGGVAGDTLGKVGRLAELKIGPYEFKRPIASFSTDTSGALADSSLQGNIGASVLSHFRVFFDYSHKRMILEPAANFAEPMDRAFAGIGLEAEGKDYHTFIVKYVQPKSAAVEAGIEPGDVISKVDGKPATQLTLSELWDLLQTPEPRTLGLKRADRDLTVTVRPKVLE